MALTIITAPNAIPTVQNDYVYQNNLTAGIYLDPHKVFPIDFDNDEIPQGTVLNVGGTIMKAVLAEAITGAQTDYVKLDHTLRTASYVASLAGVSWDSAYNGYYDVAGNLYLFDEATAYFDEIISELHLSYSQIRKKVFEEIGITKPFWTFVRQTGKTKAIVGLGNSDVCKLTELEFVLADDGAGNITYCSYSKYSGLISTGANLAIAGMANPRVARLTDTTIAYFDTGNGELRKYSWNGAAFSLVGAGFATGIGAVSDLTGIDASTVAIADNTNNRIGIYSFNGAVWNLLTWLATGMTTPKITTLSDTRLALFYAGMTPKLGCYSWDGINVQQVGNLYNVGAGASGNIAALNTTDIVYMDDGMNPVITAFRFDGTDWNIIALHDTPTINFDGIDTLDSSNIIISDTNTNNLYLYHFCNEPRPIDF